MQMKVKSIIFFLMMIVAGSAAILGMSTLATPVAKSAGPVEAVTKAPVIEHSVLLYDSLQLNSLSLSREAWLYAIQGYENLKAAGELENERILSIIDFSLPSSQKRLFIIDMKKGKVLFNTYVSHGKNSGKEMATRFSNRPESFQSSLGFYVTGNTYRGQHGYSLRLEGQEAGINDNAELRNIVIHGAAYVNDRRARAGYIGRSLGCPAIPASLHKAIINVIRDGSCLFIYSSDHLYLAQSKFLAPAKPLMLDSISMDSLAG